jgi:FAD:protein FMN transferase
MLHEYRFRAMNTDVAAWLWTDSILAPARLREVETLFGQVEAELSRFRPASGLSRLNAEAGRGPRPVSPLLQTVLAAALREARASGGIFDPTMLQALRRAGYDRSFELLQQSTEVAGTDLSAGGFKPSGGRLKPPLRKAGSGSNAPCGWEQVRLDAAQGTVTLPKGLGIDLGGIAKGWAVDRAAEMLADEGAALVDAGGDIRSTGAPGGGPWPVAVQHPLDAERDLGVIELSSGAIATSSAGGRRWQQGDRIMHHLIDPRTGEPSRSNLRAVTVTAPTTVEAEVSAKVALILGREDGAAYLKSRGLSGLLMDHAGGVQVIGELSLEGLLGFETPA